MMNLMGTFLSKALAGLVGLMLFWSEASAQNPKCSLNAGLQGRFEVTESHGAMELLFSPHKSSTIYRESLTIDGAGAHCIRLEAHFQNNIVLIETFSGIYGTKITQMGRRLTVAEFDAKKGLNVLENIYMLEPQDSLQPRWNYQWNPKTKKIILSRGSEQKKTYPIEKNF